ncbi:MAG: serine/threonine-protein kinase [Candidatus Pseudobacter hemicellulosilyticus]|uniref:Serine/threonine-protein kinase n=1 Tax=Candidatus Pseudobacter hemicellulosilyticus TaxID=3121375 RepID=A0AAJ5WSF1_9BACT|nr:MAG: serine/threonine-protein kinase [Pseudobacter sp.]
MATSIFKEYFKGYEILGELGRGNARVLKARHMVSGEDRAIKHFAFNTDPVTLRRFQRESEIMKSIQHHHIVKIMEVHLDAELPYIVMQLIEGGDLRGLLRTHGTLDITTIIRLAFHMTEALHAIHEQAVVHRDVKPENIMYRRQADGSIHFLLTDFGIARLREQSENITVTGASMLTYDYASPEQFNQSRQVSAPTDYYSLGIVLYECLTGAVPFEYEQDDLLLHINRVIGSPIPSPHLPANRQLPPSLWQLLQGLLTKNPYDRITDPQKVRHLLRMAAFEDNQGMKTLPAQATRTHTIIYQPTPIPVKSGRQKDITFTALLLLGISGAVFFSWTFGKPADARPATSTIPQESSPSPSPVHTAALQTHTPELPPAPTHRSSNRSPGIQLPNGVFYDDFSDTASSAWDLGRDENSEFSLQDGKYVMTGMEDNISYSSSAPFNVNIQKDFTVSASTTHIGEGGNPFGINFCGNETRDAYYVFYITANGFYSIGRMVGGEWEPLVDWSPSTHIRPETAMNVLSVEKHDNSLRFLINDQLEDVVTFTGGYGNAFGMRVDGAQTIYFDQFIVKGNP